MLNALPKDLTNLQIGLSCYQAMNEMSNSPTLDVLNIKTEPLEDAQEFCDSADVCLDLEIDMAEPSSGSSTPVDLAENVGSAGHENIPTNINQPANGAAEVEPAETPSARCSTCKRKRRKEMRFDDDRIRYKLFKLQAALANEKRKQNTEQHKAKMEILRMKKALLKKQWQKESSTRPDQLAEH